MERTEEEADAMERAFNSEQGWRRGLTIALAASSLVFLLDQNWIPGVGLGAAAFTVLTRHAFRESKWLNWTTQTPIRIPLLVLLVAGFFGLLISVIGEEADLNGVKVKQLGQGFMVLSYVLALAVLMTWKEPERDWTEGP